MRFSGENCVEFYIYTIDFEFSCFLMPGHNFQISDIVHHQIELRNNDVDISLTVFAYQKCSVIARWVYSRISVGYGCPSTPPYTCGAILTGEWYAVIIV